MKVFDPEVDDGYTDICDYCGAKLLIYPSDLDKSKTFDGLVGRATCPSCKGSLKIKASATLYPFDHCYECSEWTKQDNDCPCDKVKLDVVSSPFPNTEDRPARISWHPQCIALNPPSTMVDVTTSDDYMKRLIPMLDCASCLLIDKCHSMAEEKQKLVTPSDQISHPSHYPEGSFDNIEKIIDGLPAAKAVALANVLKYAIRAGRKEGESLEKDLGKARNYAHRLVTGKWIWEEEDEYE